jgi:hypothetical protein
MCHHQARPARTREPGASEPQVAAAVSGGTTGLQRVLLGPWRSTPEALADLFTRAGMPDPAVAAAQAQHPLDSPDRFWDVVLGSGYRATVDALSPGQRDRMQRRLLRELRSQRVTVLRTDVVFGTAERPK